MKGQNDMGGNAHEATTKITETTTTEKAEAFPSLDDDKTETTTTKTVEVTESE